MNSRILQVKAGRALAMWTQKYLAEEAFIPQIALANFERGATKIDDGDFRAICKAFESVGVSISENDDEICVTRKKTGKLNEPYA